jgi:CO dehydrogenase maturation factor
VLLRRDEVVLLDMYAGVEHLGRATADAVDAMLVVVEPTARSLGTAAQIKSLAEDLKLSKLYLVGSKVRHEDDQRFIEQGSPGLPVLGFLGETDEVIEADRQGEAVYNYSEDLAASAREIVAKLIEEVEVEAE